MTVRINAENIANYPVGTELEFHFGAYYAPSEGTVTGVHYIPASKWFPESFALKAEYYCYEEECMVETTVSLLNDPKTDKGIGTYLIKIADAQKKNSASPWAA